MSAVSLLLVFILVTNIVIFAVSKKYIYNDVAAAPKAEAVVIPGAAIFPDGALSSIFIDRADMAAALYKAGKASKMSRARYIVL